LIGGAEVMPGTHYIPLTSTRTVNMGKGTPGIGGTKKKDHRLLIKELKHFFVPLSQFILGAIS
jgi:hypothetical protein